MTTRICSLTGSDSTGTGTELNPYRTPGKALSLTQPGDIVYLRGGTWPDRINSQSHVIRSGSSWADAPLIAAYPTETVTFRASSGGEAIIYLLYISTQFKYIRFERLIIDGNHTVKFGISLDGYTYATNIHHLRFKDCEIKNTNYSGLLSGRGANFLEIVNMHAHHCGLDVQYDHGMYLQSSDCLVDGGEFNNNASAGIQIYTGLPSDSCNRNVVRRAVSHHNRFGFILGSGANNLIHSCIAYSQTPSTGGAGYGFATYAGPSSNSTNAKILNCTSYGNAGDGIQNRQNCSGTIIKNCISFGNGGTAIANYGPAITQSNNLTTNPSFVNAGAADFHLQAGSAAINAGTALSEVPVDLDSNARPNATLWDIGAYEFGGAPAPTPPPTPPTAPSGLTVTPTSSSALALSVTDNSSNESGFEWERSLTGTGSWAPLTTTSANVTTFTDTGLPAGATRYYRARAINVAGPSAYTSVQSGTTFAAPVAVPAAPSDLVATGLTATSNGLTWTRNATNETSVEVERAPSPFTTFALIVTLGATATSHIDTGRAPNTEYAYRVRNVNGVGPSAYSNTDNATTLAAPGAAPDPVSGVTVEVISHRQLDVSWPIASGDPDGYIIKRSDHDNPFEQIDIVVGGDVTYYSDRTCEADTTYLYQIFPYNESGEATGSNIASATTVPFDGQLFTENQLRSLAGLAPFPDSPTGTVEYWRHLAGFYRGPFEPSLVILNPPDPAIGIIVLADLHATDGPFYYSSFEPPSGANEYHGRVLSASITKALPDPYNGIPGTREAQVELSNLDVNPEAPTLSEIAVEQDPIGLYMPVFVRDLNTGIDLFRLDGKITNYQPGVATAQATVAIDEPKEMETLLPKKRVAEVFPDLDLTTFKSQDPIVGVVFGPSKKVSLGLCQTDNETYWDYGCIRKATAGLVSFVNGYRVGAYIQPSEYTIVEPVAGYLCVRFTLDQRDRGQPLAIQFDLTTTEFAKNPAREIKFLLSDTTYGLGQPVDTEAFVTASTAFSTIPVRAGYGLYEQQEARVWLRDLLLHGAFLERHNITGDYTIGVDTLDLHPQHEEKNFQLGFGTTDWHNIVSDPSAQIQNETQRLKELVIEAGWDPYFNGNGSYHIHTKRDRAVTGKADKRQNRFIVDTSTADRQTHYLWHRTIARDRQFPVDSIAESYVLDIGHRVKTTVPTMQLDHAELEVLSRTFNGLDLAFSYLLAPWSIEAFEYAAAPIEEAPYDDLVIDYRRTPPTQPTNFAVDSAIVRMDLNTGLVESIVKLRATHATVNITHIHFVAFRPGSATPVKEIETPVTFIDEDVVSPDFSYGEISLHPGLAYDLECFAVNKNNDFDRQESSRAIIADYTAPGDTEQPAPPTHLFAKRGSLRTVFLTWDASVDAIRIREYWVERSEDHTFTTGVTVVAKVKTTNYTDTDTPYDAELYYRAKALSRSGLFSDYSNVAVMKVVRALPSDYGKDSQFRYHRAPLSQIVYIVTVPANSSFAFTTGIDAKKYEWQAGMLGVQATPSWNGTTPGVGTVIDGTRLMEFQAGGGINGPFSVDFDVGVWNGTAEELVTVIQASGS